MAIDYHNDIYAVICGHGKPSASRIFEALKNHIVSGSTLIHDGERAHDKLIKELDLKEEFYKANTHDKEYLENMALINNMCSWLKRYIYRFIGMRMMNLNFYDIQQLILDIHPDLKTAWQLKDDLVDFYDKNTYETAPEALKELIRAFASSDIKEMIDFSRTLRNWQYEIINSFIIVKRIHKVDKDTGQVVVSDLKLNNGLMENRNSILKTIKKSSNGYTNWDRFRNRCLYILRKSSVPSLNPIIPKKRKEKYMK